MSAGCDHPLQSVHRGFRRWRGWFYPRNPRYPRSKGLDRGSSIWLPCTLLFCLIATGARAALAPADVEFFETRIRPVLAQDCYECHRTNGKRKGGLALDHRQALLTGGDSGPALVPGKPAESLLLQAIRHESDDLQMPKAGAKLEPAVVADFERWIRLGAPDPRDTPPTEAQVAADTDWNAVMQRRKGWWSFQPLRPPDLARFPAGAGRTHPVDRLLAPGLAAAGLTQAPRADDLTRLRRLSYVLRGLPPTPAEIDAFLRDARDDAYTRIVDTWLATPAFGERWARHWMDWVRYADSHGSEGDAPIPYAWRYRDYLIRALNADVPYDQLVREHLAGDLLPAPRLDRELGLNESALGIGHLRMVLHGFAPVDALEEKVRFTDDQINVVSKAFLGLTVSCARCHDHKFDPISQRDFTSWYGIFTSSAPATVAVDAPDPAADAWRAGLVQRKEAIRAALATAWLEDAESLSARLLAPDAALTHAIGAAKEPSYILHTWFLRQQGTTDGTPANPASVLAPWRARAADVAAQRDRTYPKRWDLGRPADFGLWRRDGAGVARPGIAGDFAILPEGDRAVAGPYPAGVFTHLVSSKDRGVMLSPPVQLDRSYDVWLRITGDGGAFVRYAVQNYPREGSVYPVQKLVGAPSQWLKLGLDYWLGDQIHLEATTAADQPVLANVAAERSWFGLSEIVVTLAGEPGPIEPWSFTVPLLAAWGSLEPRSTEELARGYADAVRASVRAWRESTCTDAQAQFIDGMVRAGLLRNRLAELPAVAPLIAAYREREAAIVPPTRAPGVIETGPVDQPLFVRGNHKQPAERVPRHFLEAIDATPYQGADSGRRALADDLLRPENPLTARVIVNRVWHHVFGRGLVATPDNFGRMGEPPSHPEVLDYLAAWFVEHGWSMKALIRFLVTSQTWQAASERPAGAAEKDPDNVAWSHANVRRLEAEAIRDALFAVSGDLNAGQRYGPPVTGRVPRRSVYLRVKRNDLDPFLAVFDAPVPAGPTGRRDVTNVPGQSLTMLNDPLVRDLAAHWAKRIEADATLASIDARITAMYRQALGRPPTSAERERSQRFVAWVAEQGEASPWAELGHALFNLKEFIFIR